MLSNRLIWPVKSSIQRCQLRYLQNSRNTDLKKTRSSNFEDRANETKAVLTLTFVGIYTIFAFLQLGNSTSNKNISPQTKNIIVPRSQ